MTIAELSIPMKLVKKFAYCPVCRKEMRSPEGTLDNVTHDLTCTCGFTKEVSGKYPRIEYVPDVDDGR